MLLVCLLLVLFQTAIGLFQKDNLQRQIAEIRHENKAAEADLTCQVDEYYQQTKALKEEVKTLVLKAECLEEDLIETRFKLSASEGRVVGLENEITKVESMNYL